MALKSVHVLQIVWECVQDQSAYFLSISVFFSLGIGFAVYLILAFWLRLKDLVYAKRTSVFDL
jgi:hypothetical protein